MRTAVDRLFDLLESLSEHGGGRALADIAREAKIARPSAHRLLSDLMRRGVVRQNESGRYALTLGLPALAVRHLGSLAFLDLCRPELDQLAGHAQELVRLAWRDGDRLVLVAESQGAKPGLRFDANLGRPVILHAMAAGKVFLASHDRFDALRLVREQGQLGAASLGPRAIRTEEALETELARVRRQGFAVAVDEGDPGAAAVATPIEDRNGQFFGSLAIVGPTARWTRTRLAEFAPELKAAAARIAAALVLQPFCRSTDGQPRARGG